MADAEDFTPLKIYSNLDDHGRDLITGLYDQYKEGLYTDFTVKLSNSKVIKCHRNVLAAKVPFFQGVFATGQSMEGGSNEMTLDHTDPYCAEALIEFCYSGTLGVPWEKIQEMVDTAECWQVTNIKAECDEFIKWKITKESALEWYIFAHHYDMQVSMRYIEKKFMAEIYKSTEFLEMQSDTIKEVIDCYPYETSSSKDMLLACLHWLHHDMTNRKEHLKDFLKGENTWSKNDLQEAVDTIFTADSEEISEFKPYLETPSEWVTDESEQREFQKMILLVGHSSAQLMELVGWILHPTDDPTYRPSHVWDQVVSFDTLTGKFPPLQAHSLCGYSVCSASSGCIITGGAFNLDLLSQEHGTLAPLAFCQFMNFSHCKEQDSGSYVIPPMSQARFFHGSEFVNNKVYVFGGLCSDPRGVKSVCANDDIPATKMVECLDLSSMDWKPKRDMPNGILNPMSFVHDDEIYVLGYDIDKNVNDSTENEEDEDYQKGPVVFQKYNTITNKWVTLPKPPLLLYPESNLQGVVHNGTFHCMAHGYEEVEEDRTDLCFASYNIVNRRWEMSGEYTQSIIFGTKPVTRCVMFVYREKVYCMFSRPVEDLPSRTYVYRYRTEENRWIISHKFEVPQELTRDETSVMKAVEVDFWH